MDKLAAMRAFVQIVDHGSLTAAAVALGKAQPTMVRTLANLETALGVRLLRRTTRRISLTEEGRGYLERCRQILSDVEEAERALIAGESEPRGELKVTAPVTFGQWHVAPLVTAFLQRHPKVRFDLLLLDRVVNLLEEGVDLALRIGPLPDSTLVAAPVGTMRRVVVASPELLERVGEPGSPDDLSRAPCVQFRNLDSSGNWRFEREGRDWPVPVAGPLTTNQCIPAVEACAAGMGFGRFLAYQVAPWVRKGELRVVLQAFEPPSVPVSLVYTEARLMTPRLRVLMAFMKARLRDTLGGDILQ